MSEQCLLLTLQVSNEGAPRILNQESAQEGLDSTCAAHASWSCHKPKARELVSVISMSSPFADCLARDLGKASSTA